MRKVLIIAATGFVASCLATASAVSAASISNPADQSTFERRGAGEPGDDRGNHGAGHPVKADGAELIG